MLRKKARLEAEGDDEAGSTSGVVSSDGVVMHNGAFVDINSIMQNLNKSEKSRVSMEARLKELQQELGKFLLPDATWLIIIIHVITVLLFLWVLLLVLMSAKHYIKSYCYTLLRTVIYYVLSFLPNCCSNIDSFNIVIVITGLN